SPKRTACSRATSSPNTRTSPASSSDPSTRRNGPSGRWTRTRTASFGASERIGLRTETTSPRDLAHLLAERRVHLEELRRRHALRDIDQHGNDVVHVDPE